MNIRNENGWCFLIGHICHDMPCEVCAIYQDYMQYRKMLEDEEYKKDIGFLLYKEYHKQPENDKNGKKEKNDSV